MASDAARESATDAAKVAGAPAASLAPAAPTAEPGGEAAAAASDMAAPTAATAPPARPTPLAPPAEAAQSLARSCEARAGALLDAAQAGDFAAATRDFDATMLSALPPDKLRAAWQSLSRFGALQARGQSHAAELQGYLAITVPLLFENGNLYAQVTCGSDGRIAGFYVKPLPAGAQ